jgi:hypothetical protein
MFGGIPKLIGRDFIIGYFLPAILSVVSSIEAMRLLNIEDLIIDGKELNFLIETSIVIAVSLILAVILLSVNSDIMRVKEGYGSFNPAQLLRWLELKRYNRMLNQLKELKDDMMYYVERDEEPPYQIQSEANILKQMISCRFPDEKELLPTAFGNTVRAFESYPLIMYGVEATTVWPRLLSVIPTDYLQFINRSKASVDFWLNLWFLSVLGVAEFTTIALLSHDNKPFWFILSAFCLIIISSWRARKAAELWGGYVKSSFDVFLPALQKKLHLPEAENNKDQKVIWEEFSLGITYQESSLLPNMARKQKD